MGEKHGFTLDDLRRAEVEIRRRERRARRRRVMLDLAVALAGGVLGAAVALAVVLPW